ncbi:MULTISPECIES: class E sortase [Cryobacterium]|uniref:Class E sortase n=1 Tax=Cryobacterium zhongshanensis TaxID=2928153 RepID=A0AA41QXG6_9MICO|nr:MULTISPECIES: class E sortase [Cryobacterium]MCI4659217.1 class E sortase [Cryobacterium zhongshanensis]
MSDATPPAAPAESRRARRALRRRKPVSVIGVFGEVLITGGVLVFLFIAWQLWWNDLVVAGEQSSAANQISQQWIDDAQAASSTPTPTPTNTPTAAPAQPSGFGTPVVAVAPAEAQPFAVLYVPRYGAAYSRTIAEGVGLNVLNSPRLGIGHYPGTQMPGEVGNFVVAAHRSANGGGMHLINELQLGDPIFVQTADGYYTYRFRDLEYVQPTDVGVLAAVPHAPGATATDRIITLTSCNPLYSTAERIIAYGVFDSWQPISAGPPAELAAIIAAQAAG